MSAIIGQMASVPPDQIVPAHDVSFGETFKVWLRVGLLSFSVIRTLFACSLAGVVVHLAFGAAR